MLTDICPVQWTGRQAVIALPEHIDVSNARPIREELLSVINRGAEALIADLTATISCDHAGADALSRGYQRAVVSGTELRLVVTAPVVRQILSLNGLDRLVPIYPSLQAATAARAPATVIPVAATRPERPVAGITPAVTGKLVDALQDGVALTDGGAALPQVYATAWAGLHQNPGLAPGQTVLVRGATSSLGQAAVNVAAEGGATVITMTRQRARADLLRDIGAAGVLIDDGRLADQVQSLGSDVELRLEGPFQILVARRLARAAASFRARGRPPPGWP